MDWRACVENRLVKDVSSDASLIDSLRRSAEKKYLSAGRLGLDDITAASILGLYYEALRELLEAAALQRGYKVYNHECYCSFLQEIMGEQELSVRFNRFRQIRNSINYDGKDLTAQEAVPLIKEIKMVIRALKTIR